MRSRRSVLRAVNRQSVFGLDASLNSTGYAYRMEGEVYTDRIKPGTKKGCSRLWHNKMNLGRMLDYAEPTVMVIEGYAMGGKRPSNNSFNIGEWGGIARLEAWSRGIMVVTVTPSTLKQLATGKGNADKPQMIRAVADRFYLDISNDDEADAFLLMAVGEAMFLKRGPEDFVRAVQKKLTEEKSGIAIEQGMMASK